MLLKIIRNLTEKKCSRDTNTVSVNCNYTAVNSLSFYKSVISIQATHFPRASSTSPRLASTPLTRPLQLRGISSSAG